MKIFYEFIIVLENSLFKCIEIKLDVNILIVENKLWNDIKNGFV